MLHDALDITDGPTAIRFPKTPAPSVDDDQVGLGLAARQVRAAGDPARGVCLIGVGKMLAAATGAAELLAADGIDCTVWDPRCVKPLDEAMLADAATHRAVVTIEDGFLAGGIGSAVASALDGHASSVPVHVLGIPECYLAQGKPDDILASLGLDAAGVAATVKTALS
jgi:1-deoxy-D-xylulose-5-phosphate synthase